jgi:hypothetical protein
MDDEARQYAQLANAGYSGADVDGYDIDRELSNRHRTVYVSKDTGKATLALAGTRLNKRTTRMGDLGTDALLALGLQSLSSRFQNSKKVARAAIEKYGQENVSATGHSLGGSQALYLNQRLGVGAHAYNPGAPPSMVRKSLFDKLSTSLFKRPLQNTANIYFTGKDPISILSPLVANARTVRVKQTQRDAHSLKNFLS